MPVDVARLREMFEMDRHRLDEVDRVASEGGDHLVETLSFRTGEGESVRGLLTRPNTQVPAPAILYIHAHGARYDIGAAELTEGRPALQGAFGPVFAAMGYATLAIDLPCFGSRAGRIESDLAKDRLWHGRSLAGQMVGEQAAALDWLAAQPFVDASRIGCYGISMGATFGYWLAAVDRRVAAVAQLCCYADFDMLIDTGGHDLHGIYLTVPGLLDVASNGEIAGLVAPRPQLIGIGDRDPLTPPSAVDKALGETRAAYVAAGAPDALMIHREAETGHQESAEMRAAVLAFFRRHLG